MSRSFTRPGRINNRRSRRTSSPSSLTPPRAETLERRILFVTVTSAANSGPGTLREAIISANATPSADVINLNLPAGQQVISLLSALPGLSAAGGNVTITGTGAGNVSIFRDSAALTDFNIIESLAPELSISGATIGYGKSASGGGINAGAGTKVTLDGVVLTGNSATLNGGAINLNAGAFLTLRNSAIIGNTAISDGGGVYFVNGGGLVVENSTISGNSAGRLAGNNGGGVYFSGAVSSTPPTGFTPGTLIFRNSTIANNVAGSSAGGIAIVNFTGDLRLQNCTITGNTAQGAGGGTGGGVCKGGGTGTITATNTLIARNENVGAPDIGALATTVNANYCAIGSNLGFTLSGTSGNNLGYGVSLKLGPIGNYGGLGQTVLPDTDSPLIDAGSNALIAAGVTTDQRGSGYTRASGAAVDIGAYEVQSTIQVTTDSDSGAGSLRAAITAANATPEFDTITFSPDFFCNPRTISLITALPAITGRVTIDGPGAKDLTLRRDPSAAPFRIFNSIAPVLNLIGMTVTGGTTTNGTDGGGLVIGGAAPNVSLYDMNFSGNSAPAGGEGGAIYGNVGAFLSLRKSTIADNTAGGDGGGIGFTDGGGLTVEDSTISGNTAGAANNGGGVYWYGAASESPPSGYARRTVVFRNSTIANNTTGASAGGIAIVNSNSTLLLQNSTVTANTALGAGGGTGGGICQGGATATISLFNSIVAGNTNAGAPDIGSPGSTVNVNYSAIGSALGYAPSASSGNNLPYGINLKLGSLGDYGGRIKTFLPQSGSPLINAGSTSLLPPTTVHDTRGRSFSRLLGTAPDIGADESGTPLVKSSQINGGAAQRSQVNTITFNFDVPVTLASGALSLWQFNTGGSGLNDGSSPTNASAALGAPVSSAGGTLWTYSFVGGSPFSQTTGGAFTGSLTDGIYKAQLDPTKVTAVTGAVALGEGEWLKFHRLFGDNNGDAAVNPLDYQQFRNSFGKIAGDATYNPSFDFDNNGSVNPVDYIQFRGRFGKALTF
jgi:hypothetical protein